MSIEVASVSAGVAAAITLGVKATLDYKAHRWRTARRATAEKYLSIHVDDFLLESAATGLVGRLEDVAHEILVELPAFEYTAPIGALSGRFVFEARSRDTFDAVVIKTVLDERRMTRARLSLFNEALVLSHLGGRRSPRLVKAAVTARNRPYLVREMLPGVSLDRVLFDLANRQRPPRMSQIYSLVMGAADAVRDIHKVGVVHGDLKPANVLAEWQLSSNRELAAAPVGAVSLLDFEAGSIIAEDATSSLGDITRGTPFFMAPERYAQPRISPAADVYSLSALTALLLTGRPERPGSSAGDRILSPTLRNAIRRGMNVDVRLRQPDVDAWRDEIDAGFRSVLTREDPEARWPRDPDSLKREIAEQAVSVSLGTLRAATFERVAGRIGEPSLDTALFDQVASLDETSRRLIDLVWTSGRTIEVAAATVGTSAADAERRLQDIAQLLDRHVKSVALERERARKREKRR